MKFFAMLGEWLVVNWSFQMFFPDDERILLPYSLLIFYPSGLSGNGYFPLSFALIELLRNIEGVI